MIFPWLSCDMLRSVMELLGRLRVWMVYKLPNLALKHEAPFCQHSRNSPFNDNYR